MPAWAGKKNASLRMPGGVCLEFMCNWGCNAAPFDIQASTRIEVPVISTGFSSPSSFSMVGATSASTPPSRTFTLRLPT
ncbi:hypothetical protein D9M71_380240 [compost metagenome]